jgi:protein-S-isoprenylcysteine O-methyltransferase Ste14
VSSFYRAVVAGLWAVWVLFWIVSATNVKRTEQRESLSSRAAHFIPMVLAAGLVLAPSGWHADFLFMRFVRLSPVVEVIGCVLVLLGLLFAIWARAHLGRNWSGRVSLKESHELIQTGPYELVRHPIYTVLLLALFGTALVAGEWRGLLATALMLVSYGRKLRLEERLMLQTFGEQYQRYRERTAALIPFVI